jgi:hypothetical protein
MSAALPVCAAPPSTRPARHPTRAVSTALVTAIALACSTATLAQQDPKVREVLEAQRRGLEEGGDKMRDGVRKLENPGSQGMEGLAEGMADVAEGFCTAVNANADAFAELGIDFSDMVASAAGGENAAKYSQAKDVCGQMQAEAESFALTGCTDIVVGSRTTLTVTAARGGGSYRFSDNKPGVLSIATHGASATLTATAPGIVTVKAERTDKARSPSASEVVYSLEVKSINRDNPVQMGLYDAKGRPISHHDVPVEVVPRGAARRVIYRPASNLLTAVGDADSTLTLRASAPGRTTVQAMTTCGQATGPTLEVEVVPCTDEVRAELRAERDRLHKRRDRILAAGGQAWWREEKRLVHSFLRARSTVPRAAEALKIPFVASGGMADGRSLVAALSLGAAGMNMGTRFIATKEAPVHQNVKNALVAATGLDTRLIMRSLRNTERVLKNANVDRLLEIEREKGDKLTIDDIHDQVAGVYPRIMLDGQMDAGAWSCGMVAGLIHDIPSVKELIDRIMSEAEAIIRKRLEGFLAA